MINRSNLINQVLKSLLAKEIFKVRVDTLWKMLYLESKGVLPLPNQEGATGRFDNKGAIFIPGGFIIKDSDKRVLKDVGKKSMNTSEFKKQIYQTLNYDNATLIYPNSIERGVNLPNEFFIDKSSKILGIEEVCNSLKIEKPVKYFSDNITMSLTPEYMMTPFGARTKVSSCISVCISNPRLYYLECMDSFGVRTLEQERVWEMFKNSMIPTKSDTGDVLYNSHIVVLHDTRYFEENMVGVTRFLALRNGFDYATLTFEKVTKDLQGLLEESGDFVDESKVVAKYNGFRVAPILRFYIKEKLKLVYCINPKEDLDLDLSKVEEEAKEVYTEKILR